VTSLSRKLSSTVVSSNSSSSGDRDSKDSLCDSLNSTGDRDSGIIGDRHKDRDVTSIANLWSDSSSPSPPLPSPAPLLSHSTPKLTTPTRISNNEQQGFPTIDDRLNSLVNSIGNENSENSNNVDKNNKSPVSSPNTDNQV
jgi:hypothetical protein